MGFFKKIFGYQENILDKQQNTSIESYIENYVKNRFNTQTKYILTTTTNDLYTVVTTDGRRLEVITDGNTISLKKETKQSRNQDVSIKSPQIRDESTKSHILNASIESYIENYVKNMLNTQTKYVLTTTTNDLYVAVTTDGRRLEVITDGKTISLKKETKRSQNKDISNKSPTIRNEVTKSHILNASIETYIQNYVKNRLNTQTKYVLTTTTNDLYIAVTTDGRRLEIITDGKTISLKKETKRSQNQDLSNKSPAFRNEVTKSHILNASIESFIENYVKNRLNTETKYVLTTTTNDLYIAITTDGRRLEIITDGKKISLKKERDQSHSKALIQENKSLKLKSKVKDASVRPTVAKQTTRSSGAKNTKKDSFIFLSDKWNHLYYLAKNAEENIFNDTNLSLIRFRMFGEQLTKIICDKENINLQGITSQEARLRLLGQKGIITEDYLVNLHEIRIIGNKAVHELHSAVEDAKRILEISIELAIWFDQKLA
ncbi:DUF4145 domain-containing protein [Sutcliffiella halmapala]